MATYLEKCIQAVKSIKSMGYTQTCADSPKFWLYAMPDVNSIAVASHFLAFIAFLVAFIAFIAFFGAASPSAAFFAFIAFIAFMALVAFMAAFIAIAEDFNFETKQDVAELSTW